MSDIVSPLLQWLNDHPQLAGLFTFIISAAESVAIIGTIVPGSIMMTAIGALAGAGVIPLWPTLIWAILGAIVGDGISYWIGRYFKERLHYVWPFKSHPQLLITGEKFFLKYGSMSVFIGRFVGPVRALVPMVAGMFGMKPLQFYIANIASAIGWAPAYMLPGIMLGAASLELPPDIAMHVILALFLIFLFILLCLWFIYITLQLINKQINQFQNWIWNGLRKSRYFSSITIILKHHNPAKTHGQFTLALLFIAAIVLFLCLALYVKITGANNIVVNDVMFHLFRGLSVRSHHLDTAMLNITLLGQKQVILPLVLVLATWFALVKRYRVAIHVLALGFLTGCAIVIFKHIFMIHRPWGVLNPPETFSLPSGHTLLATTIYMGLAFLIAKSCRPAFRKPIYFTAVALVLLVGLSRLYLGVHWFTDVLNSYLLGTAILTVVIISFQRQNEKPINVLGTTLVSIFTILATFWVYHMCCFAQMKIDYSQVDWPTSELTMSQWWEKNEGLPAYRASLYGHPSQLINIEWAGNLEKIRTTLATQGWIKPPARDLISTLHRVADVSSTQYLPLISPQYLDKKPALILMRTPKGQKDVLVIRLWSANRTIKNTHTPVWVGIVSVIPRTYSWLFKQRPGDITIDTLLLFPTRENIKEWEWKKITMKIRTTPNNKRVIMQKIILVREKKGK